MIHAERYLIKSRFTGLDDFRENLRLVIPDRFNFGYNVVDEYARIEPDKIALVWTNDKGEHRNFTFREISELSDQTAAYFQSLGIGTGNRVMLILKRRYEFWLCLIALHKLGAVCIPATHLLKKKDLIYRNNAAQVQAIVSVGEEGILKEIESAFQESPSVKIRISVGPLVPDGWHDFMYGIETAPPFESKGNPVGNSDISLLYFTSGTTGNPKMVVHDFAYPLSHITTALFWHQARENGLHLTVADTGWAKAVWGKIYGQWLSGCAVFVYDHDKFTPSDMLAMIEKYRITSFCAPPTIYRYMIREDFSKYDLSSLESCTVAGEPLNPEVYNRFLQYTGLKLKEGYGQTESVVSIATWPWMEPKPGSMGIPNPIYEIVLLHPEGRLCEDGETGEIAIRTGKEIPPGLFKGYHMAPERTATVWYDGLYHSGDLSWRDEDGYYWFVGRLDDVIKSSGYRIGPFEVESSLMEHPAVLECAVTAAPDDIRGQVVKATIVLVPSFRPGSEELKKDIQNHVKNTTAPYKYPRIIEFVNELPKTISGKIRRVEIREKDL